MVKRWKDILNDGTSSPKQRALYKIVQHATRERPPEHEDEFEIDSLDSAIIRVYKNKNPENLGKFDGRKIKYIVPTESDYFVRDILDGSINFRDVRLYRETFQGSLEEVGLEDLFENPRVRPGCKASKEQIVAVAIPYKSINNEELIDSNASYISVINGPNNLYSDIRELITAVESSYNRSKRSKDNRMERQLRR